MYYSEIIYGICVRCAGYQMLRASGLCYDCAAGQQFRRGNGYEPWEEVVYYCGRGDLIKIGTSNSVHTRVHQLRARLLATEPGGFAVEHDRHRQFAAFEAARAAARQGFPNVGEWFHSAPELLAHIKTLRLPHQRISHRG
jgi:hypothetical protein